MKVAQWIAYRDRGDRPDIGTLGGWFGFEEGAHDRWAEYIDVQVEEHRPYFEAIKADVLASGRFIGGDEHQEAPDGVPLFDDGTVASFTFRAWGDLMAAIASEKFDRDFSYMAFYMRATMPELPA